VVSLMSRALCLPKVYNQIIFSLYLYLFRSPPPSTGRLKLRDLNINTPSKNDMTTPSKNEISASKRSNASTGGHKFRALLSSQCKSPTVDSGVSRTLFH